MHEYKSLVVTAIDAGSQPFISMTLRAGDDVHTACSASKRFPMEDAGEVRAIIGWASMAFLRAADELSEDGWEIRHTAECLQGHLDGIDA